MAALGEPHGGDILVDVDGVAVEDGDHHAQEAGGRRIWQQWPFAFRLKPIPAKNPYKNICLRFDKIMDKWIRSMALILWSDFFLQWGSGCSFSLGLPRSQ